MADQEKPKRIPATLLPPIGKSFAGLEAFDVPKEILSAPVNTGATTTGDEVVSAPEEDWKDILRRRREQIQAQLLKVYGGAQ